MPITRRQFAIGAPTLGLTLAATTAPLGVAAGNDDDDDDRFGAWIYEGTVDSLADTALTSIGSLDSENDADDLDEFDLSQGKLSMDSPLARALLGKRVDDDIVFASPGGEQELYIAAVSYTAP